MAGSNSSFLDKVLGRIGRLDTQGLQTVVERLARERSFLETLFNAIEDGVLVVDEAGRILYFNDAATRLLGLQPDTTEGQPIGRILPQVDWSALAGMDRAGGSGVVRHEFEVRYPQARFVRLYIAPLDGEKAGSSGMALILHDATEARQKTFEAIESERVQALTLLAASVAHEIGNPLNALHIHLQLIERELRKMKDGQIKAAKPKGILGRKRATADHGFDVSDNVERLETFVGVAKGEITRLDYIITQFLQAIRPTEPKLKPGSLNDVVTATLELLGPELENRGIQIETDLLKQLPLAPIDAGQIKQVLVNLIKNAMQAMTKGGVLTLQTGRAKEGVWLSVGDTGTGIPSDKVNKIFEPFFTTKEKGTGLGLMIVQRIVREHDGRMELESHQGEGTTFRVWLPLHEPEPLLLEAGGKAEEE